MIKIKEWGPHVNQVSTLGRHSWDVARLIQLSAGLPVMEIPLEHLNFYTTYDKLTLREMVMHVKAVMAADLSYPIILDEDGEVMDGRHRIMKALMMGVDTIKAVRFEANPFPCKEAD